jgi:hypothetical protein
VSQSLAVLPFASMSGDVSRGGIWEGSETLQIPAPSNGVIPRYQGTSLERDPLFEGSGQRYLRTAR